MTLILSNDDVERLLTMDRCIGALEPAYRELAAGEALTLRARNTNGAVFTVRVPIPPNAADRQEGRL